MVIWGWRRQVLLLFLEVWIRGRVPRRRPASVSVIIPTVGDEYWLILFLIDCVITLLREPQQGPRSRVDRDAPAFARADRSRVCRRGHVRSEARSW